MRPLQNSFRQLLKIILDKRHMTESLIGAGAPFHKTVNPAVVVEPVETPFHLPALARIAGMATFRSENGGMIVASPRNTGMDTFGKKAPAERVAVISFVRANPSGESDFNTINRADGQGLIVAIGARHDQREEVPLRVNDDTPFYPLDTMFSRVSAVFLAPFFDFTTEASRYPLRQWR